MTKIDFFKNIAKATKASSPLRPGVFNATVVSVEEPEGYAKGQAIDVTYEINVDGVPTTKSERFHLRNNHSERNKNLLALYQAINAVYYDDLIGTRVSVDLKYEVSTYGKRYLNIVDRQLITEGGIA